MHGDPSGYKRYDQLKAFVEENGINTFLMCFMAESMREAASLFTGSAEEYRMLRSYLSLGGSINRASLLRYICSVYGGSGIPADPPVRERMQGLYHPRMDRGIGMDDYLKTLDSDKPAVGVVIGQSSWVNGHTEPHDLLIGCIESLGACTIPVFTSVTPDEISGSDGIRKVFETYFYHNGKRLADSVVLCGFGFSTLALGNPGDGSGEPAGNFFMDLDVPVLASLALFRSREEWEKDGIGMEGGELCISVAMPEVDGQLTTVPFIFNEKDEAGRPYTSFVPDRIRRIAEMAVRWAKTGRSPVKDRKVSILLNASSMTNSSIGEAGGLDSLESVAVLLKRMKAEGYTIDHVPSGGRELIDELLDNVTDDLESVSDEFIERKAAGFVSLEKYLEWMDRESSSYREWVCRDWG